MMEQLLMLTNLDESVYTIDRENVRVAQEGKELNNTSFQNIHMAFHIIFRSKNHLEKKQF